MKIDDRSKHSYPPITQSADNDASNERNLELLREEFTKTKPRNNMLHELMAHTKGVEKGGGGAEPPSTSNDLHSRLCTQ